MSSQPQPHSWDPSTAGLALAVLGRRWVPQILHELRERPLRRHVLRARLGVTDKVLTETLRVLEHHALVGREVTAAVPAEVTYSLTAAGIAAETPLVSLSAWWAQLPGARGTCPRDQLV